MKTAATLLMLLAATAPCGAQTRDQPLVFIDAGVQAGIERRSHLEFKDPARIDESLDATVAVGTVSIGTFLAPRVSLRVEAAIPTSDLDATFSPPTGTLSSIPTTTPTERVDLRERSHSVSVLAGFHTGPLHAVRFGYVAGAAFVYSRQRTVTEISFPAILPVIPARVERTDATAFNYRAAFETGLDVEASIGTHLALVPHVRVIAFAGALSVRPGVALRWSQ